jgi:hypothetical protein
MHFDLIAHRIINVEAIPFPQDGDNPPELLAVLHGRLASPREAFILAIGLSDQRYNNSNCLRAYVVCVGLSTLGREKNRLLPQPALDCDSGLRSPVTFSVEPEVMCAQTFLRFGYFIADCLQSLLRNCNKRRSP